MAVPFPGICIALRLLTVQGLLIPFRLFLIILTVLGSDLFLSVPGSGLLLTVRFLGLHPLCLVHVCFVFLPGFRSLPVYLRIIPFIHFSLFTHVVPLCSCLLAASCRFAVICVARLSHLLASVRVPEASRLFRLVRVS